MRKCPVCEKTFDDSMRFCQTDGTPLLDFVEETAADPLKTTVIRQDEIASAIPPEDPFRNAGGGLQSRDDSGDLLQLPEEFDPMKTIVSRNEPKPDLNVAAPQNTPLSPFDSPFESVPTPTESKSEVTPNDFAVPEPPKFSEPSLSPPNFGNMSAPSSFSEDSQKDEPPPTAIYMPQSNPFSSDAAMPNMPAGGSSPFEKPLDSPLPSPFSEPPKPSYENPPVAPYKDPEPMFSNQQNNPFDQPVPIENSPFNRQNQGFDQPIQQSSDWNPPPSPGLGWQDQGLGANTPFQPPTAMTAGQDQTLAITSIATGASSLLLFFLGIIPFIGIFCAILSFGGAITGIVTGILARMRASQKPEQYTGAGLALGGIITGTLTLLLFIGFIIIVVAFLGMSSYRY